MNWSIFVLIFIFQIALTIRNLYNTCAKRGFYLWFIYTLHHLFDIFLFWSWLFLTTKLEYKIHLLVIISVIINWIMYENNCIITIMMNRECGYPKYQWFDSIKNMMGLESIYKYFHFVWMIILACQDIYMILS